MKWMDRDRLRPILAAACFFLCAAILIHVFLLLHPHVPGVLGAWMSTIGGVVTTPFFMEASLAVLGLSVVSIINHWRLKIGGDELVEIEVNTAAEAESSCQDKADPRHSTACVTEDSTPESRSHN
jgi:hypothetical protein